MYKVLVVDDDRDIINLIRIYLERDDIEVHEANDGLKAAKMLKGGGFDLAVIDIMLPGMNGLELIKSLRKSSDIPVVIISAKAGTMDKVFGLEIGADDYITKPFDALELAARVKSAIRRYHGLGPEKSAQRLLKTGDLTLDLDSCSLMLADSEIEITSLEFNLLKLFMQNPGRVLTSEQIFDEVWKDSFVDDNSLRVAISKLRSKIGDKRIKTIRGLGYRMEK